MLIGKEPFDAAYTPHEPAAAKGEGRGRAPGFLAVERTMRFRNAQFARNFTGCQNLRKDLRNGFETE